jgi:guanosine-3',5'-bis(diphosphate) 3'-pyrophosphohydrolase
MNEFIRALVFAAAKHREQRRKDAAAAPYINHPIAVANVLANEAGITDPIVLCAALLHDTIEDTKTTAAELEEQFGHMRGKPKGLNPPAQETPAWPRAL